MNQWTIIGNLTRDPETGTTQGGVNWCRFTVAVRKKYKREGQPDADFVRVTAWRGLGDTCAKYLAKGRKVCAVGVPGASGWKGTDGEVKTQLEMTADEVEFLSGGGGNHAPTDEDAPPAPGGSAAEPTDQESGLTVTDPDDLLF